MEKSKTTILQTKNYLSFYTTLLIPSREIHQGRRHNSQILRNMFTLSYVTFQYSTKAYYVHEQNYIEILQKYYFITPRVMFGAF
jgi:hypothetical protein